MTLVAVLSARSMIDSGTPPGAVSRRGELAFAGQCLVEYQARQAASAGAEQVAVLVDTISPALTAAVDRLAHDGIQARLVQDLPMLGAMVEPGDDVLIIGDGHVLPLTDIKGLGAGGGPALLVLPSCPGSRAFERLDAQHMWAGAALLPARLLLSALDMLGDWDVQLTLVRRAVQEGAGRLSCDMTDLFEGRIVLVDGQAAAEAATAALTGGRGHINPADDRRDLDDWPVAGPAEWLAPLVIRHEVPTGLVRLIALACSGFALVTLILGILVPGLALAYLGLVGNRLVVRLDRIMRLSGSVASLDRLGHYAALGALCLAGLHLGGANALAAAAALTAPMLIALIPFARRRGGEMSTVPWLRFAPGTALLLLIVGTVLGMGAATAAVITLLALASLAFSLLSGPAEMAGADGR